MSRVTRTARIRPVPTSLAARNGQQLDIRALAELDPLPLDSAGLPLMYEDEGMEDMGDSDIHTRTGDILLLGTESHLSPRPEYQVFWNLDLHYSLDDKKAYVSPDLMIVKLRKHLKSPNSYRIGRDGPVPACVTEVLSKRSQQQRDRTAKPVLYARLKIPEYILVDPFAQFMKQTFLLKRLRRNGTYEDCVDADGGVTSRLGFRLVLEDDGLIRVVNAQTGVGYPRPRETQQIAAERDEAERRAEAEAVARRAEAEARRQVEERLRELEQELARLKSKGKKRKGS